MSEINISSSFSEEEKKRLEKIERLDSNKKRKKLILAVITSVLILFFILGTIFGAVKVLSFEGTEALPAEEASLSELVTEKPLIIEYVKELIENNKNYPSVKLDISSSVAVPDESISIEGENAEYIKAYFLYIKDSLVSEISTLCKNEEHKGSYGEDFSSYLPFGGFGAENVICDYEVNPDNEKELKYMFDFGFFRGKADSESLVCKIFGLDAVEGNVSVLKSKLEEIADVDNFTFYYDSLSAEYSVNRENNLLNRFSLKRVCTVEAEISFKNEFSELGKVNVSFDVEIIKNFNFSRVEFFFKDDVVYIEKGSTDELRTKVISDQSPSEIKIEFTSSDPSVLSIDGSFYKGENVSAEPVTVKAEYTYNGVTYTDTCIFYVRVPVEGVKVKEKEITLTVGKNYLASAEISPSDATLRKLYWFSSDESIASVNEEGMINAVSEGTVTIYCITLDGNYKSVSTVIIEAKEGTDNG